MIKEQLGIDAAMEVGHPGQFDVLLDGEVVASKGRQGLVGKLFGLGFPDPDETVAELRRRTGK